VTARVTAAATLPPDDLPGLDPAWSRLVTVAGPDGTPRTWHVLDNGVTDPVGTLMCVHGNPTWSYLWRAAPAQSPPGWRVLAPDHLGMGWSERTGQVHRLADRIAELGALTEALEVRGPVVILAHDWGGAISLGWALDHQDQLAGIVLTNTAVHQPAGAPAPGLIRLARTRGVHRATTVATATFVRGTVGLLTPGLAPDVRAAYLAPYRTAARRAAVGAFVEDIPLDDRHPSWTSLQDVVRRLPELADRPALLLWGPRDPVFSDRYLQDLQQRFPRAVVHRYEGAGHLVTEESTAIPDAMAWIRELDAPTAPPAAAAEPTGRRPLWSAVVDRAGDGQPAVVEMSRRGPARTVTWAAFARVVDDLAAGLAASGVERGHRVALLVTPGADLSAVVYACWRIGAVIVVADAGLGLPGLRRALRGAQPDHVVAVPKGLVVARAIGLPGQRIAAGARSRAEARLLGARLTLADVARAGRGRPLPPAPDADAEAAVLFTSGATGPAKGVVYRHRQLEAQRDALARTYGVTPDDRLVAAFAPFALYGPALGITSVVPDMEVTSPGTLEAAALADAVETVAASLVFASPAALASLLRTSGALTDRQRTALGGVRLLLSTGAPVPAEVLRALAALLPKAEPHTPYGMTEAIPVADITLAGIEAAGVGDGVCVGRPVNGVEVLVSPLGRDGSADGPLTGAPGVLGEICVRAPQVKDRYDRLWATERASSRNPGWHRTGDVGHLDDEGRLWVGGRLAHVIVTAEGPVAPVGLERQVESTTPVPLAAAVGVGPVGTQQVVVVVQTDPPAAKGGLADLDLADAVRAAAGRPLAAVLVTPALPVDIRHNSKIDRASVARWAEAMLSGRGGRRP